MLNPPYQTQSKDFSLCIYGLKEERIGSARAFYEDL